MKQRALGNSGLEVPVVILGAWAYGGWFWGRADDEVAVRALHRALDVGMVAIDTAPVYGLGRSETVVGKALAGTKSRACILTKCGLRWDDERGEFDFNLEMPDGSRHPLYRNLRPDSVRHECEESLRRLGVETIDLYQCHWPDPTTPIAETMGEMVKLHHEGKIRAVGVSNFTPEMMEEARTALGKVPLASNQPKYNLLSRRIEDDVVPYAMDHDIGLIVYSPLEQGLLTGKITGDRTFPKGDYRASLPRFSADNRALINAALEAHVVPVAKERGATVAQITAAWTFHRPGITAAIVGARTPDQVEENAGAARIELTGDEVDALSRAFAEVQLQKPGR